MTTLILNKNDFFILNCNLIKLEFNIPLRNIYFDFLKIEKKKNELLFQLNNCYLL